MRSAGNMMQTLSASELRARGYLHARRMLVISVDGQGTQDSSVARRKSVGGLFAIFGLVSGAQIDSYNFETLNTMTQQLQLVTRRLREAHCAEAPIIDGARCDDVDAALVRVSLAGLPDTPERERLLAIPTGLTIARADVDRLVRAGHDAVTTSAALRRFLDAYPPAPLSARTLHRARRVASVEEGGAAQ
jgi:hypothetical protein